MLLRFPTAELLICLSICLVCSASSHHHRTMERRETYQSQPAEAEQTAPGSNDQNQKSRFSIQSPEITNTRVQESTPATKDLFHQFLSRAMFSCATKYVGVLQKLNKLIVDAHQEYKQCQDEIAERDRSPMSAEKARQLAAQLDMINELFNDDE